LPEEKAAWELVKWISGKEVSRLRTEHGGTPTPSQIDLDFNYIIPLITAKG